MISLLRKKRGVTILEIVVSMGIFVTVVTLAVGGFILAVRLQRKSLIMRETQQNSRIALEIISKYARQARAIDPDQIMPNSGVTFTNPDNTKTRFYHGDSNIKMRKLKWDSATSSWIWSPAVDYNLVSTGNIEVNSLYFDDISNTLLKIRLTVRNKGTALTIFEEDETTLETTVVLEGLSK